MGKARITWQARRELDEIWAFVARDAGSIDRAETVVGDIIEAIRKLADMPGMGARRDDLLAGIRSFPVHRFLVFYRKVPDGIQVIHVVHGARNLTRLFRRRGK